RDSAHVRAVGAAVVMTGRLDSVSDDLAMAVLALGGQSMNRALETVEDVTASGERDFEGLVVIVSTDLTDWHLQPARAMSTRRYRRNQPRARRATSESAPGSSKRWVAPRTTTRSFSVWSRARASWFKDSTW